MAIISVEITKTKYEGERDDTRCVVMRWRNSKEWLRQ